LPHVDTIKEEFEHEDNDLKVEIADDSQERNLISNGGKITILTP
jgi:hypothetical protein